MVDEIKKTEGDSLPEKGQTSKGETETTSQKTPETFDKEQVEKAVSDALAKAGRTDKELTAKMQEADRILASAKQHEKELSEKATAARKDEFERRKEANRDDPTELKRIEREEKAAEREAKLAEKERELDKRDAETKPQLDELAKSTKERNAREIATKYNVAEEDLLEFTDGSEKAMEALASKLPKKAEETTLEPDSGKTSGGGTTIKREDILSSIDFSETPAETHKRVEELERKAREGLIK